jgi:phage gpG-like protein
MRRVAVRALDAYPLVDRELRFVADEENATFRVDATGRALMAVIGSCSAYTARHAMGGMSTQPPRSVLNWTG